MCAGQARSKCVGGQLWASNAGPPLGMLSRGSLATTFSGHSLSGHLLRPTVVGNSPVMPHPGAARDLIDQRSTDPFLGGDRSLQTASGYAAPLSSRAVDGGGFVGLADSRRTSGCR